LVQYRIGIIDLAATSTSEVAAKQRLQHQHKRVALDSAQMLAEHVGSDADLLMQRDGQYFFLLIRSCDELFARNRFGELCRHAKTDVFGDPREPLDLDLIHLSEPLDQFLDKLVWRRCPRGDTDRSDAIEPARVQRVCVFDQVSRNAE